VTASGVLRQAMYRQFGERWGYEDARDAGSTGRTNRSERHAMRFVAISSVPGVRGRGHPRPRYRELISTREVGRLAVPKVS
jgi:hypothetical protein